MMDKPAERAVLAGIMKYGEDAYYDVADILSTESFTVITNRAIYDCLKRLFEVHKRKRIDIPSIHSVSQELGTYDFIAGKTESNYLEAIINFPVELQNVREFAAKVAKLHVMRVMYDQLDIAKDKLSQSKGDETILQIIGAVEDTIFDFSSLIHDDSNEPKELGKDIDGFIASLVDNPVDQIGFSTGFPRYDEAIGGGLRKGTVNIIGARPKALAYDEIVYTKNGSIKVQDVKIGQEILHPFDSATTVKEIYTFDNEEIYRIRFCDGSYVDCCKDHRWNVRHAKRNFVEIKTTSDLINDLKLSNGEYDRTKWRIPLTFPVNFNERPLKIDPYFMGCLLGDGSFRHSLTIASADSYILNTIQDLLEPGYYLQKTKYDEYSHRITHGKKKQINKYREIIKYYGLWMKNSHNKFIPRDYLYNSIENRKAILQGLFDADGCPERSAIEYSTTSIKLAKNVKFLVESLGGIAKITSRTTSCNGKLFDSYRMYIKFDNCKEWFRLPRKINKAIKRSKRTERKIVSIRKLKNKNKAYCYKVSAKDELFLTSNFTVTMNTGKTLLTDNMGYYIAKTYGIPVLNLDTEMKEEDHKYRSLAMLSEVGISDIETGKFGQEVQTHNRVKQAGNDLKSVKYFHQSVAGKPFEEILAIARRWIMKEVGVNSEGKANECVIFYDYLKLMDAKGLSADLKEFQLLGFMMTGLHNFSVRYDIPILTLMQLNRDGITNEGTDVASGSDRIIWLCSNFTIFKRKSDEELAEDGVENGTHKLVPIATRHGAGLELGNYINVHAKTWCAQLKEGLTKFEAQHASHEHDLVVDDENIPFE